MGYATALAIVVVGAAIAVYLYVIKPSPRFSSNDNSLTDQQRQPSVIQPLEKKIVHLYFKDRELSFLEAETRELVSPQDTILLGKGILDMLIRGPEQGLGPTIPRHTGVRAFFIAEDGTAYADLTGNIQTDHPGGSVTEMLTVYSIVNSLVLNIPVIKQVKLLIDGQEAMTLAGHIDIRNPLKANMLMVR